MLKKLGVFKDYNDGSLKSVFNAGENKIIEMSLLMNKETMDVVCAPTHHFCCLGCKMCHLTQKGLNKKMTTINIEDFEEALIKSLTIKKHQEIKRRTNKKKLLISFMGVGEPLLNIKLIKEIYLRENKLKKILVYEDISYALATMIPSKEKLLELKQLVIQLQIPLKIHFSLHNPIDKKRRELIPATTITINEALDELVSYQKSCQENTRIMERYNKFHRTNEPIEIHYTLIEGKNDSDTELKTIITLLKQRKIALKFIKFNPKNEMSISKKEEYWVKELKTSIPNLRIKQYTPPGKQIGSSCGEFTKHYYHEEIETEEQKKEFEKWKEIHEIEKENIAA